MARSFMTNKDEVEKTKERIEGLIKTVVEDSQLSDNDWVKKYGEVPYWEVLSPKLLSLIDEEKGRLIKEVIDTLTSDITHVDFIKDGRKQWEVLPNRGVEPCLECSNGGYIRELIKALVTNHLEEK